MPYLPRSLPLRITTLSPLRMCQRWKVTCLVRLGFTLAKQNSTLLSIINNYSKEATSGKISLLLVETQYFNWRRLAGVLAQGEGTHIPEAVLKVVVCRGEWMLMSAVTAAGVWLGKLLSAIAGQLLSVKNVCFCWASHIGQ